MISPRKLTPTERAVTGICPVCHAQPGEACKPASINDVELYNIQFAHIARLVIAPTMEVEEA